ncbi:MAG: hypothetical protein WCA35_03670 [Kovacikia sp.]
MLFLSLLLFWLAYTLVGWFLAAHHLIWYFGLFVAVPAVAIAWGGNRLLLGLFEGMSKGLLITIMLNVLIALMLTLPTFSTLIAVPTLTAFLAWLEMQSLDLKTAQVLGLLAALAGLGLGTGEFVDLVALPSERF